MAYLAWRREFRAWQLAVRQRLPLDCLLCGSRTPGGLCVHCRDAVTASMGAAGLRCARCELRLPGASGSSPLLASCPDCALLSPALSRVVAAFDYAWPGDLLIQRLKLQGRYACAPVLARLLAQRWQAVNSNSTGIGRDGCTGLGGERPLVTAVPASQAALRLRGYNPAAELGRALAQKLGLDWQPGVLQRVHEGGTQKNLSRLARHRAVQNLYNCPGGVAGRAVLVVDDVMTTGSTLNSITLALHAQGAAHISAVVLARTPFRTTS